MPPFPSEPGRSPVSRALIVAPTPFFGDRGCHVRILEQIRALERRGVATELVTYPFGRSMDGVTTLRTPRRPLLRPSLLGPNYARPFLDADLAWTALRVARRFQPHVLHAHLHEGIVIGAVVRRLTGIPLLADLQGSLTAELTDHGFLSPSGLPARGMTRFERWLVRKPDAVVVSSSTAARELQRHCPAGAAIEALVDGVDLDHFRPMPPDPALVQRLGLGNKRVVVYLGVLTGYQGIETLLDAAPRVARTIPNVHFLVMGYPNEEHYRTAVRGRGLEHLVSLPGRIPYDDAARYLALGIVAVSAKQSLSEANGKLLNYMACGLPVVATDTEVNREILGDVGLFAPVGDAAGLGDHLAGLLDDPARRAELSVAARARAEREYGWPRVIETLVATYARIAGRSTGHRYATESERLSTSRV